MFFDGNKISLLRYTNIDHAFDEKKTELDVCHYLMKRKKILKRYWDHTKYFTAFDAPS